MPDPFVHELARCESERIGAGTRVWAFACVLAGARIGADCNICDHVFVENDVVIGDRVTVKSGVQIWDGLRLQDDVFIGPNATFCNDRFPRSKQQPERFLETHVGQGASIGANATILPGIRIGPQAMIGAGAVVTDDVPSKAIIVGNPGRISGYVGSYAPPVSRAHDSEEAPPGAAGEPIALGVGGTALLHNPSFRDMRGSLVAAELDGDLPFQPVRVFVVYDVPSHELRGEHAHRECHQFLIAAHGSLSVVVDDGTSSREVQLDRPEVGLYLPPMVWGVQHGFTRDAVLLVLASHAYDSADYVRSYDEFLQLARRG